MKRPGLALMKSASAAASRGGVPVRHSEFVGLQCRYRSVKPRSPLETGQLDHADGTGEDAVAPDDTVDTTPEETIPPTPVTRPPGDVKVAVANGVGEAGLAGARASVLSTTGYVTVAANAAAETAQSQVYYVEGYGEDAQAVAVELGGDAAVLRPAPSDPGALVTDATAVDGFHVFVILGTDRVLG